ncbi:MAG TPA: serine/threonine-protein kinase [Polyangiaceae bacterium]
MRTATSSMQADPMAAPPIKPTIDIRREMKQCPACRQRFSREAAFCPFDGTKLEAATYDPLGDPMVGATVDGRYVVVSLLGEGGMGHVYEVRHASLDKRFAMKVLRRELARDPELGARFIDEAKATAKVRHGNVVQIIDFGHLPDGIPYFVMELLVGRTLGQVIKSGGAIPAGRAVRIIEQVASALEAAHEAGVVHRDLKPENVFLVGGMSGGRASDDVRVVDFGAAKIIGSSRVTKQGIVFGTPHYMSPEQASGQPVDHRADIYALGIIMYEMFSGRVPFEADTYMGVLTQHMFVQPRPPSEVSPAARELGALEEITMTCLAKKPEERYASMKALLEAVHEVVQSRSEGKIEIARHSSPGSRPSKPPHSVKWKMADELEPPSLAEMRVAIDSVLPARRPVPWGWIAGGVGVLAVLAGAWALLGRAGTAPPPPQTALPAPSAAAVVVAPTPTIPPPPAPAASPEPTAAATTSAPAVASAPTAPAATRPPPRRTPRPSSIDDVGDPFAAKH